jgi:hypothetical protein
MDFLSVAAPVFRAVGAFVLEFVVYVVCELILEGVRWLLSRLGRCLRAGWELALRKARGA